MRTMSRHHTTALSMLQVTSNCIDSVGKALCHTVSHVVSLHSPAMNNAQCTRTLYTYIVYFLKYATALRLQTLTFPQFVAKISLFDLHTFSLCETRIHNTESRLRPDYKIVVVAPKSRNATMCHMVSFMSS